MHKKNANNSIWYKICPKKSHEITIIKYYVIVSLSLLSIKFSSSLSSSTIASSLSLIKPSSLAVWTLVYDYYILTYMLWGSTSLLCKGTTISSSISLLVTSFNSTSNYWYKPNTPKMFLPTSLWCCIS